MSVVINSNYAATIASNNLATSNSLLQRSLNRLSSGTKIVNPADDAGGLAVSMKLSAAAKREGAVSSNIGNGVSFLQSQDGVLKTTGKVLERIGELKTLASDPTKNASDLANYNSEFAALQAQLTSLGAEKFNNKALFGTTNLAVGTTEDGTGAVTLDGVNLLGTSGPVAWSNVSGVAPGADWTASTVGIFSSGGYTRFHSDGTLTSTQTNISGPFTANFTFNLLHDGTGTATLSGGGSGSLNLHSLTAAFDAADHTMAITVDASGNATWSLDSGSQTGSVANFASGSGGAMQFAVTGTSGSDLHVKNDFALTSTGSGGSSGNLAGVISATDLSSLSLSTVTGALGDVATYRAENGANQSRLGFAAEVVATNKANLEAANSRIIDVDVAEESTSLARYNILVQAGAAMLSQANQSAQVALKLLG